MEAPSQSLSLPDSRRPLGATVDPEVAGGRFSALLPWLILLGGLGPALAAVWATPWFVTQDGPAHLYNAEILRQDWVHGDASPFAPSYAAHWKPVPNWGGHLVLLGLTSIVPYRTADRVMTTLTLLALPVTLLWLRGQVWGRRGQGTAALGAAVLGLNLPWLLGFAAFLLGLSLGLVALGLWWRWRQVLDWRRAVALGGMLVLGYLGHLVALALTSLALVGLAVLAPREGSTRARRLGWTALALAPLVPLALLYRGLASHASPFAPTWDHLSSLVDPLSWLRQIVWADPITLGRRVELPLLSRWVDSSPAWGLFNPALWLGVGLLAALAARRSGSRREWLALTSLGLLGALVGPDSLGPDHGHYLPQRVALFGLSAGLVGMDLTGIGRSRGWIRACWVLALLTQTAAVHDYAAESNHRVGALMRLDGGLGTKQRVGTLLVGVRGRFRANPLLHADCLLGPRTQCVLWSNYETRFYYFPVQIRPGLNAPEAGQLERIATLDGFGERAERARRWRSLLDEHHDQIDRLLVWGNDPELDAISSRWFESTPVLESGQARVFRARRSSYEATSGIETSPTFR